MDGEGNENDSTQRAPFSMESGSDAIRNDINNNMGAGEESKQSIGMNPDSQAADEAASNLQGAEEAAADGGFFNNGEGEEGIDAAREVEENGGRSPLVENNPAYPRLAAGLYKNGDGKDEKKGGLRSFFSRGKGKDGKENKGSGVLNKFSKFAAGLTKGSKKKGPAQKYAPFIALIFTLFGAAGLFSLTQIFQPFSLVAQFQEAFGSMQVVANWRSNKMLKLQMDNNRVKSPTSGIGSIFGTDLKIGKKQAEQLKKYGIEYEEVDVGGSKMKVLKYEQDGEIHYVSKNGGEEINGATAKRFDDTYKNNKTFERKYNAGSQTWRGKFANWFETATGKFLSRNDLTRSMFSDYSKRKKELGGNGMAALKEIIGEKVFKSRKGGGKTADGDDDDDENKEKTEENTDNNNKNNDGGDDNKVKKSPYDFALEAHPGAAETAQKIKDLSGKFSKILDVTCGVMNVIGAISSLTRAAEMLQVINVTTALFESVDKTKAGHGDDSPINEFAETLNEKKKTTYKVLEDRADGGIEEKDKTVEGSAMTSSGLATIYEGGKADPNDPGVKQFNFSGNIKRVLRSVPIISNTSIPEGMDAWISSSVAYKSCLLGQMVFSATSAAADATLIGLCIAGAGAGAAVSATGVGALVGIPAIIASCAPTLAKETFDAMKKQALGMVISAVVGVIAGVAAQAMTRDLISNLGGDELGNALASGGNNYLGLAHQANGGGPMSKDAATKFAVVRQEVIAEEAENERAELSPFDITSKYTFLGTLMSQLMVFNTASGSISSIVKAGGSSLLASVSKIGPKAIASTYGVLNNLPDEESYKENCPLLSSIGGTGDAFCNPYFGSDVSTLEEDPVDPIDRLAEKGQIEQSSDGNIKIKDKSDFAKFAKYCLQRSSEYGMIDQNIMDDIKGGSSSATGSSGSSGGSSGSGSSSSTSTARKNERNTGDITEEQQASNIKNRAKKVLDEIDGMGGQYWGKNLTESSNDTRVILYLYAEGIRSRIPTDENNKRVWEVMKNGKYNEEYNKHKDGIDGMIIKIGGASFAPANSSSVASMSGDDMKSFLDFARGQNGKASTGNNNEENTNEENTNEENTENPGNAAAGAVSNAAGTVANMAIGSLPVIGDAMDVFSDEAALNDFGYINGEKCVVKNKITDPKDSWETVKDYERVAEDQSWAESVGLINKSAISVYLDEQEQKSPLDQTYEGQLARFSGLRKEMVNDTLDFIAYFNYINEYNPKERYAFGEPELNEEELPARNFEEENVLAGEMDARTYIVYADVRNRTTIS